LSSILLLLLAGGVKAGEAAKKRAAGSANGQLVIEGRHIETLILEKPNGDSQTINRPGSTVSLPAGQYKLFSVTLTGGFQSYLMQSFTLSPGKPYHVKVGAPLTPQLEASRQGRVLELDYALVDAGGGEYRPEDADPPRFTVYNGDQVVGSGAFEYG
jgi:hypothetical protein